eukprot:14858393-Alexandrium_andersonii.AAC.1
MGNLVHGSLNHGSKSWQMILGTNLQNTVSAARWPLGDGEMRQRPAASKTEDARSARVHPQKQPPLTLRAR